MVQNIYSVPPPPTEERHRAIYYLNTIVKRMQNQSYDMEVLSQANTVLTNSKYALMEILVQINAMMNAV